MWGGDRYKRRLLAIPGFPLFVKVTTLANFWSFFGNKPAAVPDFLVFGSVRAGNLTAIRLRQTAYYTVNRGDR
jgi:hypothetical protein